MAAAVASTAASPSGSSSAASATAPFAKVAEEGLAPPLLLLQPAQSPEASAAESPLAAASAAALGGSSGFGCGDRFGSHIQGRREAAKDSQVEREDQQTAADGAEVAVAAALHSPVAEATHSEGSDSPAAAAAAPASPVERMASSLSNAQLDQLLFLDGNIMMKLRNGSSGGPRSVSSRSSSLLSSSPCSLLSESVPRDRSASPAAAIAGAARLYDYDLFLVDSDASSDKLFKSLSMTETRSSRRRLVTTDEAEGGYGSYEYSHSDANIRNSDGGNNLSSEEKETTDGAEGFPALPPQQQGAAADERPAAAFDGKFSEAGAAAADFDYGSFHFRTGGQAGFDSGCFHQQQQPPLAYNHPTGDHHYCPQVYSCTEDPYANSDIFSFFNKDSSICKSASFEDCAEYQTQPPPEGAAADYPPPLSDYSQSLCDYSWPPSRITSLISQSVPAATTATRAPSAKSSIASTATITRSSRSSIAPSARSSLAATATLIPSARSSVASTASIAPSAKSSIAAAAQTMRPPAKPSMAAASLCSLSAAMDAGGFAPLRSALRSPCASLSPGRKGGCQSSLLKSLHGTNEVILMMNDDKNGRKAIMVALLLIFIYGHSKNDNDYNVHDKR